MNTTLCAKSKTPIKYCGNHSHTDWEIILHLSGHATTLIDNKEYALSPGTVMVIPPGTTHSNYSDEYYTDMYFQAKKLDFHSTMVVQDTDNDILTLMNMMHKTLVENEFHYSHIADNLTETICSFIKKLSKTDHSYPFINDLKNTIYNNLSNSEFNLGEEIKNSGYNPDYVRRCFKKVLGKPPLEYMTQLRINQAKTFLLHNTFTSIEDIAANCGFNDSFYFSTCFKKHTGFSPLQYRKKFQ